MSFVVKKIQPITAHLVTTGEYVYTCPSNRCALITFLQVANVDGVTDCKVQAYFYDSSKDSSSSGDDETCLFAINHNINVPMEAALNPKGYGGLWLSPGDALWMKAVTANEDLDVVGSAVEYESPSGQSE